MYISTTLVLFSAIAISSAIPTHPRLLQLFPRQNATESATGNSAAVCPNTQKAPAVTINEEATAEAHQRDETATPKDPAFSIKTSDGKCLAIRPECGDFRHNLIPLQATQCNSADKNQKFEKITEGKHISKKDGDQSDGMLIVSSSTLGCLNLDDRRGVPNIFSCGGRAGGEGLETDAQVFATVGDDGDDKRIPLSLKNDDKTCLIVGAGNNLAVTPCITNATDQKFTLG